MFKISLAIHRNINSKEDIPESATFFVDYVMIQIIGCNKQLKLEIKASMCIYLYLLVVVVSF